MNCTTFCKNNRVQGPRAKGFHGDPEMPDRMTIRHYTIVVVVAL